MQAATHSPRTPLSSPSGSPAGHVALSQAAARLSQALDRLVALEPRYDELARAARGLRGRDPGHSAVKAVKQFESVDYRVAEEELRQCEEYLRGVMAGTGASAVMAGGRLYVDTAAALDGECNAHTERIAVIEARGLVTIG